MTEIYIIRHVQAEGNLYRMCQGHWDGGVTPLGEKQRDALAERFRAIPIDAVYSSDLYRARFTASAITRYHDLPIHCDARFREIDLGPWEAQYFGNLRWEEAEAFHTFVFEQDRFRLPGAETYEQVTARALPALREIAERHPGQTVALTSHGVTIRCMLARIGGIDLRDNERLPIFMNTGVAKLRYEGGGFSIEYTNDYSHLSPELIGLGVKGPDLRHEYIDPSAEADYYKHCYESAWLAAHGDLRGFHANPYLSCAAEHYAADREAVARLYYDHEPAGLLDLDTCRGSHAGYGWISLLYLEPAYRHRGCGVQLLSRAMLKYSRMGRTALRLHVAEENQEALHFYERWGFRALGEEPGASGKLILMEKKLGGHDNV